MRRRIAIAPYCYIGPHVVFYVTFILLSLFGGAFISLNRWSIYQGRESFVGIKYYLRLFDPGFVRGQYFWKSLWVSLQFVIYYVPPLLAISLSLALLLHHCGTKVIRLIGQFCFLMPSAISVSVVAIMWRWVFGYEAGVVNYLFSLVSLPKAPWLSDLPWAWCAITAPTLWMACGWSMVLFLVGLQTIPAEQYEAAEVDGANGWQLFCHVTVPGLRPITTFIVITQIIGAFGLFAQPQLLTRGGPGNATTPVMMFLYGEAFNGQYPRVGSAVAMGFVTGMVVFSIVSCIYVVAGKKSET